MPTCPACKEDSPRRKNEACPKCNQLVEVHDGHWFKYGTGSPAAVLLREFEDRVTQQLTLQRNKKMTFSIQKKSPRYRREMAAANQMLVECGHDLDLAIATMEVLFTDNDFNWKTRSTMLNLYGDIPRALAIATATLNEQLEAEQKNAALFNKLMEEEDIFS